MVEVSVIHDEVIERGEEHPCHAQFVLALLHGRASCAIPLHSIAGSINVLVGS
ncbi:hypothetical protein [Devosia sp. DBB001]|nr:hypothetical protein [Devosia sp. DBB001]